MRDTHTLSRRISPFAIKTLFVLVFGACAGWSSAALAQTSTVCGAGVKAEVAKSVDAYANASAADQAAAYDAIYAKYQSCATDAASVPSTDPIYVAAKECGASISILGSTYYEEMSCCGYDPQRRQFACPVKIKQSFGFGGTPLPGSREHVLNCVANASGVLVPVGHDSVHLSDALAGLSPSWQFAVIAAANDNLNLVQPMSGQVRKARSILSWALPPTQCNYRPIWGNAIDYTIRLDQ